MIHTGFRYMSLGALCPPKVSQLSYLQAGRCGSDMQGGCSTWRPRTLGKPFFFLESVSSFSFVFCFVFWQTLGCPILEEPPKKSTSLRKQQSMLDRRPRGELSMAAGHWVIFTFVYRGPLNMWNTAYVYTKEVKR